MDLGLNFRPRMTKTYKFPAWRCRADKYFKERFYSDVRTFYRYTDGIFNTQFMGLIFCSSSQYIRRILLEDQKCMEILNKRRFRGRVHTRPRKELVSLVLAAWRADKVNTFIDDIALRYNIAVISVQTILNKRPGASEEEFKLKRPLSFKEAEVFYQRNGWKSEDAEWTKSDKYLGWGLKPEEAKKLRTFDEQPWPQDDLDPKEVSQFYLACRDFNKTMTRFNILSIDKLHRLLSQGL